MIVKGTIPIREVELVAPAGTSSVDAIKQFRALHPDARVESLDGELVRGVCRGCGAPIMEHSRTYVYTPDLGYICAACALTLGKVN